MSSLHSKAAVYQSILNPGMILILILTMLALPQSGATATPDVLPRVGLITDGGPIDDNSFNEMAYAGLHRAQTEGRIQEFVYIPTCSEGICQYAQAIDACVSDDNDLCITVGFMMADDTMAAANANPYVDFMIADMSWEASQYPVNLRGTYFAVDEAAYLAGTMAGLMSSSNKIGIVGGMSIPAINDFILPYTYGAQWADHEVGVLTNYANNFDNEATGAAWAQTQMNQGADAIFGVGGIMGNGAIKKAAADGAWVVGVDVDTYYTVFEGGTIPGSDRLLTS